MNPAPKRGPIGGTSAALAPSLILLVVVLSVGWIVAISYQQSLGSHLPILAVVAVLASLHGIVRRQRLGCRRDQEESGRASATATGIQE